MGKKRKPRAPNLERLCQGHLGWHCGVHLPGGPYAARRARKWFCDAHAEDEQWHPCTLSDQ